jgi:TPR repeat protein
MDGRVRSSRTIRTLYDVLGVKSDADPESIERAFREASKTYHPDLHGGDLAAVSRFQDIVAAAAVLRDSDRRAAYDRYLQRRRRREWLDAANRCAVAGVIIISGLIIGRLVLSFTLPSVVLERQSSVAATSTAQPADAQVRAQPVIKSSVVREPDMSAAATTRADVGRESMHPESAGESAVAPVASAGSSQSVAATARADAGRESVQPETAGESAVAPVASAESSQSAAATAHADAGRESVQPESVGQNAVAPVASAKSSQVHLDAPEIASLMNRGTEFVANGNIGAARLMFKLAAEAGEATAAFALAETYDPSVLEKLGAKGVTPDVALAQQWYEKARALGSTASPGQSWGLSPLIRAPDRNPPIVGPDLRMRRRQHHEWSER